MKTLLTTIAAILIAATCHAGDLNFTLVPGYATKVVLSAGTEGLPTPVPSNTVWGDEAPHRFTFRYQATATITEPFMVTVYLAANEGDYPVWLTLREYMVSEPLYKGDTHTVSIPVRLTWTQFASAQDMLFRVNVAHSGHPAFKNLNYSFTFTP